MKYFAALMLLMSSALAEEPFLMPVQDVYHISGVGTVVSGRLERGKLQKGAPVELVGLGSDRRAVISYLHQTGNDFAVGLGGLSVQDVKRGQVLAAPGSVQARSDFAAQLSAPASLPARPFLRIGTAAVGATIEQSGTALKVHTQQPVVAEVGWKFTLWNGQTQVGEATVTK